MRPVLKSLVAVFALIFAAGPIAHAVDFYATNGPNKNLYGINIDGTTTLIGPSGNTLNPFFDIAMDPVSQSYYYLESELSGVRRALLYSVIIGAGGGTQTQIGAPFSSNQFIEGGLAFSSFQGTNTLYASGTQVTSQSMPSPVLYSINQSTGAATLISSDFMPVGNLYDIQAIFNAPDGRLWGLNQKTSEANLFRFATDGTVDTTVILNSGFEMTLTGGVTVKNGVTYYLTSPQGFAYSNFGTFAWDSGNNTYTGAYNLISSSIIGGMTGIALAPTTVPEPSTYVLAAIASGVMAALARRRKAKLVK